MFRIRCIVCDFTDNTKNNDREQNIFFPNCPGNGDARKAVPIKNFLFRNLPGRINVLKRKIIYMEKLWILRLKIIKFCLCALIANHLSKLQKI